MTASPTFPQRVIVAVLSGIACALAFPPVGWRWLIVPGIAGLLISIHGAKPSTARGIGFLHGMLCFGIGLPWLVLLFGTAAFGLWAILALFTVAFAGMQARARRLGIGGWPLITFTAFNWSGWEFIRCELFPLKFPWMTPGLALGPNWLLAWIGVYGVSALFVFAIMALTQRKWMTGGVLVAGLAASALFQPKAASLTSSTPGVIQAAGLQYESVSIDHYIKLTKGLSTDIQHVVWPEYAVPYDIRANTKEWATLLELCKSSGITLTLGTQTTLPDSEIWYNTALTMDATGTLGEHYKAHPVHLFNDGTPGSTALPVSTVHGRIGTPICFDCDYEGVVRKMTAAGAEAFFIPIMDAESWSARQHDQHAELFRIRACEHARWLFVLGTSGVSQVIDPYGQVHSRLAALEQGVLTGMVKRETELTPYTRGGWLFPWITLVLAAASWVWLLLPRPFR